MSPALAESVTSRKKNDIASTVQRHPVGLDPGSSFFFYTLEGENHRAEKAAGPRIKSGVTGVSSARASTHRFYGRNPISPVLHAPDHAMTAAERQTRTAL